MLKATAGTRPGASIATALKSHATPTPIAMSVNMFRCRLTSDRQPRTKNGQPAHSTTGVLSANCIQRDAIAVDPRRRAGNKMRHREEKHRQRERAADPEPARHVAQLGVVIIVRRRAGVFGSSAMPHFGQVARMILLDLRVHRAGVDRLSAQPSRSDCAPAPCRISGKCRACPTSTPGHIGQKYFAAADGFTSLSVWWWPSSFPPQHECASGAGATFADAPPQHDCGSDAGAAFAGEPPQHECSCSSVS